MTTELQQERQQQAGQANLEAIQGIDITPNQGAVVPNVMQLQGLLEQMQSAKNSLPNINPPGEDEIRKTSWIASGVIGLLGAIVSGNAAGGIAAGMVAALAIHDRGYDLRQRADLVPELHQQGYTARAILNWYETGDNKELDKEAQEREQMASRQATIDMQAAQMSQADRHFNVQQKNANDRFYAGQRMADARAQRAIDAQNSNQSRADERLEKQAQTQLDSELRKTIEQPKAKQYYMQMAEKAMDDLTKYRDSNNTAGMAEAYHNVRNNLARASLGGTATLNEHDIEGATGLPQWSSSKANELGILTGGRPTDEWMSATASQIHDDIKNERATITQQGQQAYDSLLAAGTPPGVASARINKALIGTGLLPRDWSREQQTETQKSPTKPTSEEVGSIMAKYGYAKK
ncbi:hypothetical protein H3N91_003279 [Salmonella enterica]|nr:hypothetical protein [Salmonella enterica]EEA2271200.1 hypothetical protein [Salmonella enterica]EFV5117771.1 hypothetical protein [Salmonella enterica]EGB7059013.1 hypothetical protein [Salmonella enterica]EKL9524219.1 hypothetical protein [Salmonella enterica]